LDVKKVCFFCKKKIEYREDCWFFCFGKEEKDGLVRKTFLAFETHLIVKTEVNVIKEILSLKRLNYISWYYFNLDSNDPVLIVKN